ncbi:hypothetical protein X777_16344, partial [Ooceraea biroi]
TLWEVLTYPSRKLADLLAMRGAKLHSWSSFHVACGAHISSSIGPFPLLAAVSVAVPRKFRCFVRRYDSFVSRDPVTTSPRGREWPEIHADPALGSCSLGPLESSGESLIRREVISCLCRALATANHSCPRLIPEPANSFVKSFCEFTALVTSTLSPTVFPSWDRRRPDLHASAQQSGRGITVEHKGVGDGESAGGKGEKV